MATLFLAIIYAAFISLGLPDSLLGSAWPAMYTELGVPLSSAGLCGIVVTGGTILSSLLSNRLLHRFGTGRVMVVSVAATAAALFGVCVAPSYGWLLAAAVPLGLGAGAVDAGLNNFVALHYEARHMSWLHSFWGLGATLGPIIMSSFLIGNNWRGGWRAVSFIQMALVVVLVLTLSLWDRYEDRAALRAEAAEAKSKSGKSALRLPGVWLALATFFFYCAIEAAAGLWSASYLVGSRGITAQTAARWTSYFFLGITIGRILCGFVAKWVSSGMLIRIGQILCIGGLLLILLPLPAVCAAFGLGVFGLGCAPVYPCMIHETPRRFGAENSPAVIGLQMAVAYTGSTLVPPLFGVLAQTVGVWVVPVLLLAGSVGMLVCAEALNRRFPCKKAHTA